METSSPVAGSRRHHRGWLRNQRLPNALQREGSVHIITITARRGPTLGLNARTRLRERQQLPARTGGKRERAERERVGRRANLFRIRRYHSRARSLALRREKQKQRPQKRQNTAAVTSRGSRRPASHGRPPACTANAACLAGKPVRCLEDKTIGCSNSRPCLLQKPTDCHTSSPVSLASEEALARSRQNCCLRAVLRHCSLAGVCTPPHSAGKPVSTPLLPWTTTTTLSGIVSHEHSGWPCPGRQRAGRSRMYGGERNIAELRNQVSQPTPPS